MQDSDQSQHPCGNCGFYSESVWQPVAEGSVSLLARGFVRRDLDAGQVLFEQASENRGVYCVSKGLIALRTRHADGASTLLRLAYPGEIIGFRAFLGNRPHQTEARALLDSRVCTVARRGANRIVQANPTVLARLAARCIEEIDRNHARIIAAATTSNKQRFADLLLRLMQDHGERTGDCLQMQLPLSRSDLADLLGVQPETLSRLVGRLEKDGFCRISGRRVMIPVPDNSGMTATRPA
jgi:CRP-like cAMP-binding protein